MSDVDKELLLQESSLEKDKEIDRILSCYEHDHFAVLDLLPETSSTASKIYRKKSLLIHPDKTSNPSAPSAFDRLRKSLGVITSEDLEELKRLKQIYEDILKDTTDIEKVRLKAKEILINIIKEEQIERLYKQQTEAKRQAEISKVQSERELKRKMESKWESTREDRVKNWRDFSKKIEKKKKKKPKVLA